MPSGLCKLRFLALLLMIHYDTLCKVQVYSHLQSAICLWRCVHKFKPTQKAESQAQTFSITQSSQSEDLWAWILWGTSIYDNSLLVQAKALLIGMSKRLGLDFGKTFWLEMTWNKYQQMPRRSATQKKGLPLWISKLLNHLESAAQSPTRGDPTSEDWAASTDAESGMERERPKFAMVGLNLPGMLLECCWSLVMLNFSWALNTLNNMLLQKRCKESAVDSVAQFGDEALHIDGGH